jgi:hypothetical protein
MFTVALFIINITENYPKDASAVVEWVNKLWYIHTVD